MAANVPISKFKADIDNEYEDIANTISVSWAAVPLPYTPTMFWDLHVLLKDVPRPKPTASGGNPHLFLLPLFKQLPKIERPFYSQAKALTFFLNDIADEITVPDANTARSADELGRFVFLWSVYAIQYLKVTWKVHRLSSCGDATSIDWNWRLQGTDGSWSNEESKWPFQGNAGQGGDICSW